MFFPGQQWPYFPHFSQPNPWLQPGPTCVFGQSAFTTQPGFSTEPPTVFMAGDPNVQGVTGYKYKTASGQVPNEGRTPGAMNQQNEAQQAQPMAPMTGFQPMPMWTNPCLNPFENSDQIPPPPTSRNVSGKARGDGCYIVKYFRHTATIRNAPVMGDDTIHIPTSQLVADVETKRFSECLQVRQLIEGIGCRERVNAKYREYPEHLIGVQQLSRVENGKYRKGPEITLTDELASHTIEEVFQEQSKEILLLRLP